MGQEIRSCNFLGYPRAACIQQVKQVYIHWKTILKARA